MARLEPEYNPILDIPPDWRLEFRGFFMGEGCVQLLRYPRKKLNVWSYRPQLGIRLRADERPLINQILEYLGGLTTEVAKRTTKQGYTSNPSIFWYVSGWKRCRPIVEQVLLGSVLEAHKRLDLDLLHQAILYRFTLGNRLGQEGRDKMEEFREAIMNVRKYSDC